MYQTKQQSLYEVQGKTPDNGRIYDTYLCLKCGGFVAFLPTEMCGECGYLTKAEVIKVPETFAIEAREAIREATRKLESYHTSNLAQ